MSLVMKQAKWGNGIATSPVLFGPTPGTTTWAPNPYPGITPLSPLGNRPVLYGQGMMGDPGLFSFLGKAAKAVTGVVGSLGIPGVSGAAKLVHGILPGGAPAQSLPVLRAPGSGFGGRLGTALGPQQGIPTPGVVGIGQRLIPGGATGYQACPSGARPNKTRYFTQADGWVEPGTKCVRRRRMNPLNPRALSRSMRRITSAKKAVKALDRIHIGGRPRARSYGKACGHKGRCKC